MSWAFFSFCFLFNFFTSLRYVHGRMGMDVWVNVFTMPFLCADSGPWRQLSRARPTMSAIITSSGSTCLLKRPSFCICWTHLQIFFVSTVLGEKTSDVDQSWRASANLFGGRLLPTLDRKRTTNWRRHVWWVECFALCYFRNVHGWIG